MSVLPVQNRGFLAGRFLLQVQRVRDPGWESLSPRGTPSLPLSLQPPLLPLHSTQPFSACVLIGHSWLLCSQPPPLHTAASTAGTRHDRGSTPTPLLKPPSTALRRAAEPRLLNTIRSFQDLAPPRLVSSPTPFTPPPAGATPHPHTVRWFHFRSFSSLVWNVHSRARPSDQFPFPSHTQPGGPLLPSLLCLTVPAAILASASDRAHWPRAHAAVTPPTAVSPGAQVPVTQ